MAGKLWTYCAAERKQCGRFRERSPGQVVEGQDHYLDKFAPANLEKPAIAPPSRTFRDCLAVCSFATR